MLRRTALLALPALVAVASATACSDEPAPEAIVAAGHTVHAAAPAAVVDAKAQVPAAVAPASRPGTRSQVIKDVLPSSVRISVSQNGNPIRVASGVIVGMNVRKGERKGYVITNTHVVETDDPEKTAIEVLVDRKGESRAFAARVVAVGEVPDLDLALLEVPGLVGEAAKLADDGDLELGDEVVAVGAPFGRGISVSSGIVSQLEWDEEGAAVAFKTDAPIGYGASGGGIFRVPDGKLLAVIEGYRTAKVSLPLKERSYSFDVPMPGETFAAPAAKIRAFLRQKGVAHLVGDLFPARAGKVTAAR